MLTAAAVAHRRGKGAAQQGLGRASPCQAISWLLMLTGLLFKPGSSPIASSVLPCMPENSCWRLQAFFLKLANSKPQGGGPFAGKAPFWEKKAYVLYTGSRPNLEASWLPSRG